MAEGEVGVAAGQLGQVKDDVHLAVCLDSTDEQALVSQEIHHADVAVVTIGENFEASLLTAAILRKLSPIRLICRAQTEVHAEIFRRLGADEIIQPESEAGINLARRLAHPHFREHIELSDGLSLVELETPAAFVGKTIKDLQLRQKYQVNVALIRRTAAGGNVGPAKKTYVPLPEFVLQAGDILVVLGTDAAVSSLPK